jgi:uncharacterized surface protein with fasciclin (FAS1) repeats
MATPSAAPSHAPSQRNPTQAPRQNYDPIVVRSLKYFVLLALMLLVLKAVFDAYSFYVARRDIDSELRSKRVSSLEYLNLAAERQRALALTALEGRCLERTELTLFRIFDAQHDRIMSVYNSLIDEKNKIIDLVKNSGVDLIDVDKASNYFNGPFFRLNEFDKYIVPLNRAVEESAEYNKFKETIIAQRNKYIAVAEANSSLRHDLEHLIKKDDLGSEKYWNMNAIKIVVDRIDQARKELDKNRSKFGDLEDVMARYAVWTGALSGGTADNPLQDEVAYTIEQGNTKPLKELNCSAFKQYYAAVNQRLLDEDPLQGQSSRASIWSDPFSNIKSYYRYSLQRFFHQPPAAQTMFVTLLLGALGALTLHMLRMSKVGWWGGESDPLWGEIIVSPLLGSLAAFGIFLVGSAGLLLTADTNGAQPLSAYFIGVLGFLSGLLYDEAFGRVRRIGIGIFAVKPDELIVNARAEDRSLAETLRNSNASRAAELILKYGIGTRLSLESEFTLLVPSNEAIGHLTLSTWTALNDSRLDDFERWYHRHHASKRVTKSEVARSSATPANDLQVDDGTTFAMTVTAGEFKVGDVRVLIADVAWSTGIIQILSGELP